MQQISEYYYVYNLKYVMKGYNSDQEFAIFQMLPQVT